MTELKAQVSELKKDKREGARKRDVDNSPTSVERALHILDCFRSEGPLLGVSQIARLTHLPKSTAFRLLNSLSNAGYLVRHGSEYRLARHVFELGSRATQFEPSLREAMLPLLVELQVRTGYTVHLGVLQGTDVLYIEKIPGRSGPQTPTQVGARMHATCTAVGKALLAHGPDKTLEHVLRSPLPRRTAFSVVEPGRLLRQVEQVRTDGLAFDREESALGLTCIAAPLLDGGEAWAAVSLSGPSKLIATRQARTLVSDVGRRLSGAYGARVGSATAAVG